MSTRVRGAREPCSDRDASCARDASQSEHPGSHARWRSIRGREASTWGTSPYVSPPAPHIETKHSPPCRKAIDRIKETVPIWKKEWDADGKANWVNLEG